MSPRGTVKPVVLSGYYGLGNVGDEAILEVLVAALRTGAPGVPLRVLSGDPAQTARRLAATCDLPDREAAASVGPRRLDRALKEAGRAGLLVSGGGGLLQERTSRWSLLYYLAPLLWARLRGVPRLVFAQGVGPLWRWSSRRLTRCALKGAALWVRDEASRRLLEELGLRPVHLTADPVFAARGPEDELPPGEGEGGPLGVVLRPGMRRGGTDGDAEILQAIASAAWARRVPVRLIPFQPGHERSWAQELAARVPGVQVDEGWDEGSTAGWVAAFGGLRAVVSARYHALVFAALAGRPVLALAVDPKLEQLAAELGPAVPCVAPPFRDREVAPAVDRLLKDGQAAPREEVERLRRRAESGLAALVRQAAELRPPSEAVAQAPPETWRSRRFHILGVPVDPVSLEEATAIVAGWCEAADEAGRQVVTCNPELAMHAQAAGREGEALRAALARADLAVADGIGLVWGARFLGNTLPGRVAGADLAERLCREAAGRGWRLFLWGGEPGVARQAAERLQERWPGLRVAGAEHGYLRGREEEEALERLWAERPDLLLVGLGAPRQEIWIDRLRRGTAGEERGAMTAGSPGSRARGAPARVMMGVGGVFDVWAGRKPRAPRWLQELGLEWLYRVALEPWRLRRLGALPRFVAAVLAERLGRGGGRP